MRSNTGNFSTPRGVTPITPEQVKAEAQGILGQSFSRTSGVAGTILSTGVVYAMAIPLWEGDQVAGLATSLTVAGTGQTRVELGLYDANAALLGTTSGDVKATYAASAVNVSNAFTGGAITIPRTGVYYAAVLGVGGTQPTLLRAHAVAATNNVVPGLSNPDAFIMSAQATLPATLTVTNAGSIAFWIAAV